MNVRRGDRERAVGRMVMTLELLKTQFAEVADLLRALSCPKLLPLVCWHRTPPVEAEAFQRTKVRLGELLVKIEEAAALLRERIDQEP